MPSQSRWAGFRKLAAALVAFAFSQSAHAASEQQAKAMVARAIDTFERLGTEAFALFNRGAETGFLQDELYIVVEGTGPGARILAQAANPKAVGTPVGDFTDPQGKRFALEISERATKQGSWFEYVWANPSSGKLQRKKAWAVRHSGLVFIAGIYVD